MLKDAHDYAKSYLQCQILGQPNSRDRMPNHPVLALEPFQKWGLDFEGPFTPKAKPTGNRYILVASNYCII